MFDDEVIRTKNKPVKGYNFLFYTIFMIVFLAILIYYDVKPYQFRDQTVVQPEKNKTE